ncbi:uncharacterized protein LOC143847866 [Tasmannia lanceolata]|uniref:uncharacterized protein LOC143847866 n=1 Tax=Tasmannia lanceolata TaxID=3420 RepID=UPI004062A1A0
MQHHVKKPYEPDLLTEWENEIQSSFVEAIAQAQLIPNFDLSRLDLYDGTTDPLEYLQSYKRAMEFKGANDITKCGAFSSYLKRGANSWYGRLKSNSISSFRELGREFVTYFANSRPQKKPADSLFTLRQGKEETLRSFIGRFRAELSQIKDPNHEMVRAAMRSAVHDRDLKVALNIDPSLDLQELMAVADKYVNNEESFTMERELELAKAPEKRKEETRSNNSRAKPPRSDNRQSQSGLRRSIHAVEAPAKKLRSDQTNSKEHIVFFDKEYDKVHLPHDDAVVVRLIIANYKGFSGGSIRIEGRIDLPVTFSTEPRQKTIMQTFLVVKVPSTYNAIIGHPALNKLEAVVSTPHLKVKFPTKSGVGEVRGDQERARNCYADYIKVVKKAKESLQIAGTDPLSDNYQTHGELVEELTQVPLFGEDDERTVQIGSLLTGKTRSNLVYFLKTNADVFAWSALDMPGIPMDIAVYRLSVDPSRRPVKQKKRNFAIERQKAIKEEIDKLLQAGFIREIRYPK